VLLPGEQLGIDTPTATPTLSGVGFYALLGGVTAVRTGSGTAYGFEVESNLHGTGTLCLDSTAQVPAWRQFDPYGVPRGGRGRRVPGEPEVPRRRDRRGHGADGSGGPLV
jgi:hypothetical protein